MLRLKNYSVGLPYGKQSLVVVCSTAATLLISVWFSNGPDVCLRYPGLRLLASVVLTMAVNRGARIALRTVHLLVRKQDRSVPAYRALGEMVVDD